MSIKSIFGISFVILALILGTGSLFIVKETEQSLVMRLGNPVRVKTEAGLYMKLPLIEEVVRLERRLLSLDAQEQEVIAADSNRLVVDSFARYRITDPLKAFQTARTDFGRESLLEPILISSLRQVIAENTMPAVITGERVTIMNRIRDVANDKTQELGLEIVDVRLKKVEVPSANREKIFQQMKTERERLAREYRAKGNSEAVAIRATADRDASQITSEAQRQASVIRGQADAYAVKVFADAFGRDEEFFEFYRTMQTYKKALGKNDTTLVLSPDSEFFKLLMNGGNSK